MFGFIVTVFVVLFTSKTLCIHYPLDFYKKWYMKIKKIRNPLTDEEFKYSNTIHKIVTD